jgi:hypothetical protein
MNAVLKDILERARHWPLDAQQELADIALEMESALSGKPYRASADELRAIDEADQSGVASPEEVAAAFAAFRRR